MVWAALAGSSSRFLEARPQKVRVMEAEGADQSGSRESPVLVGLVLGSAADWLCVIKSTALRLSFII